MTTHDEQRRYRIDRLLGKGGYGRVYRAELIGNVGFRKAVALKLLHEDGFDEKTLQRFRDEARILGLLNDPAIINVDPPTRLGGRWAVVMELAEGAPSSFFLKRQPWPAGVAAELIGECARALDYAYNVEVDGEPLRLLHRDLKPANVMITTAGSVKILDFGIAKATFEAREAQTTKDLAGTVAYMAPERLEGEETPAGDVFSLGVMLRRYIRRDKSLGFGRWKDHPRPPVMTEAAQQALQLAGLMYQLDASQRPSMREVEDWCERIRRLDTESPSLRRWVEGQFPGPALDNDGEDDPLLGKVLTEGTSREAMKAIQASAAAAEDDAFPSDLGDIDAIPDTSAVMAMLVSGEGVTDHLKLATPEPAPSASTPVPAESLTGALSPATPAPAPTAASGSSANDRQVGALLGAAVALLLLIGVLASAVLMMDFGGGDTPVSTAPTPSPVAPAPAPVEEPVTQSPAPAEPEPEPSVVSAAPAPAPASEPVAKPAPAPKPAPSPEPVVAPEPVAEPAPAVVEPEPEPAAPVGDKPLTLGSVPTGATVFLDGANLGVTPLFGTTVAFGAHDLKMVDSDGNVLFEETIEVGSRTPNRYVFQDGQLGAHY